MAVLLITPKTILKFIWDTIKAFSTGVMDEDALKYPNAKRNKIK